MTVSSVLLFCLFLFVSSNLLVNAQSDAPTAPPTETFAPTEVDAPTRQPPTRKPPRPTRAPTDEPATSAPTDATNAPTDAVTSAPTAPTPEPTATDAPTDPVTNAPTDAVTSAPTAPQTQAPTDPVTNAPTAPNTPAPTAATKQPTLQPITFAPTPGTPSPTAPQTSAPTEPQTGTPTAQTAAPTEADKTPAPTAVPTGSPAPTNTGAPTDAKPDPSKLPIEQVVQVLLAADVTQLNEVLAKEQTGNASVVSVIGKPTTSDNKTAIFTLVNSPDASFGVLFGKAITSVTLVPANRMNITIESQVKRFIAGETAVWVAKVQVLEYYKPGAVFYIIIGAITLVGLIISVVLIISLNKKQSQHDYQIEDYANDRLLNY